MPQSPDCPSCGTPAAPGFVYCLHCGAATTRRNRLRSFPWLLAGLFALAVVATLMSRRTPTPRQPAPPVTLQKQTAPAPDNADTLQVGRYLFKSRRNPSDDGGVLEITRNKTAVETLTGGIFLLTGFEDAPARWKNGDDVNGDGIPEVVVQEYTGGAHCCTTWHIFTLSDPFRRLAEVEAEHSDLFPLKDVNGDGKLELMKFDWSFAYWKASFADSPAMRLLYTLGNGVYEFAPELMRKPPPSADDLRQLAAKLEWGQGPHPVPPAFWANLLHLIETGNASQIRPYLDAAWPESRPGREAFMAEFWDQLRKSKYVPDLKALNHGVIGPL